MSKNFAEFLQQLSETNATLDYFTDFEKVKDNVGKIELKLNQLNYLIGKENLKEAIYEIYNESPKTFDVLDILIAIRKNKRAKTFNNEGEVVLLDSYFASPDLVVEYINQTGLASVFRNKNVTNLVDYVFGVEVGLDTNARKNRGGDNMSRAIAKQFDNAGIYYSTEVNSTMFIDILTLGVDVKRFDFVVKTRIKTYLIEANYYNSGGSKLNEVARSYSDIALKINQYDNYEFVWITDGQGWLSAKSKLEEAYNTIPKTYNLTSLKDFIHILNNEIVIEY